MILPGPATEVKERLPVEHRLPVMLLSQYLYFLSRRPISESNLHYLQARLHGLQSLAPALAGTGNPALDRVVGQLRQLHPAAFRRIAGALQLSLIPLVRGIRELPDDLVVQDATSVPGLLDGVQRVLLVFGPGIGIGDELILAPLPAWLRAAKPELRVTTLSGYRGFWSRVHAVDAELQYSSNLELLEALRGAGRYSEFDLVAFVDFEAPELYRAVAAGHGAKKYLEISLGARSAFLVDSARRWLYRIHHITPYFANYYHALHQTLRVLGLGPRVDAHFAGHVRRQHAKADDRLDVFVSPFTSKYDPSSVYWGRLVTGIAQHVGHDPVCLHLDTGKTWRTQRFAIELARALAPMLPSNVELRLARDGANASLSLPGVYDYLDRCHAVLCADSFAAHAGPLFDCLTLVLAKEELKDWQVPFDGSYYFDPQWPIEQVSAAMGELLAEVRRPRTSVELAAAFSKAELDLCALGTQLDEAVHDGRPLDESFASRYRAFAAHHGVVAARRRAAREEEVLIAASFAQTIRAPEEGVAAEPMALHLRDQLERWQNTNFAKYVRRASRRADEAAAAEASLPLSRTELPAQSTESRLAEVLLASIRSILREQLPSGEIATYFRAGQGSLEYRRTPLLSSFVHDALGTFDLKSRWVDTDFLDALPAGTQGRFVRAAALVRNRIRRFLLWEEGNEGGWRFNGRTSGVDPDGDTTACVAAAVLQAPRRKPSPRWRSHTDMVLLHARGNGNGNGHGGACEVITRANILRFLALIGEPVDALAAEVLDALRRPEALAVEGRYVHPLVVAFCVARAWAHTALPGRADVAELVVPRILEYAHETPDFGGPLGTALALNALLDLEYAGPETIACGQYLLDSALPRGGWAYAAFLENGGGAPAFSSALAMTALARSGVGR